MGSLSILREAPAHIFSISLNRQNIYLCYGKPTNDCPVLFTIGHFTVVCLVTWPLGGSEAGGDLVLIQTLLLFTCKSCCSHAK